MLIWSPYWSRLYNPHIWQTPICGRYSFSKTAQMFIRSHHSFYSFRNATKHSVSETEQWCTPQILAMLVSDYEKQSATVYLEMHRKALPCFNWTKKETLQKGSSGQVRDSCKHFHTILCGVAVQKTLQVKTQWSWEKLLGEQITLKLCALWSMMLV